MSKKKVEKNNSDGRGESVEERYRRMYPVYDGDLSIYSYSIKCAICGAEARAQFNRLAQKYTAEGWRLLKPPEFAKRLSWICPKHAEAVDELQKIIDEIAAG